MRTYRTFECYNAELDQNSIPLGIREL